MEKGTRVRLTRRPIVEDDDQTWLDEQVLLAQSGDEEARDTIGFWILDIVKRHKYRYSWIAMKNGVRIWPEDYSDVFVDALWRMVEKYDGRKHFSEFIGASKRGGWRIIAVHQAAIDVWRAKTSKKEAINTMAVPLDKSYKECAIDEDPRHDPIQAAESAEMWRLIGESGGDVAEIACMYCDGYTLREIADALGYGHPTKVQRKLQSLRDVLSEWRR